MSPASVEFVNASERKAVGDHSATIMDEVHIWNAALVALRADREVMMVAVQSDGLTLRFASVELRDDREIVLTAVAQNSNALEAASERLEMMQRSCLLPRPVAQHVTQFSRLLWLLWLWRSLWCTVTITRNTGNRRTARL